MYGVHFIVEKMVSTVQDVLVLVTDTKGGVAEWFKAAVLKTAGSLKGTPQVRILLPPPRR